MNIAEEYKSKLRTADEAVKVIKSGDWIDYSFGTTEPVVLDAALAKRKDELKDIKIRAAFGMLPRKVVEVDPKRETFTYSSWHLSGIERKYHDKNLCNYIPLLYRDMPVYYRQNLKVNVAMFSLPPMNKHGYFSFGLTNSASKAIAEAADIVIVEVNDQMPVTLGGQEECIHLSEVDYIVEGASVPVPTVPAPKSDEIDEKVATLIMEDIVDGATIQLGIGGMPNAVGTMIANSDLKDLGMHTEMLVDAYLNMFKTGKLTNKRKAIDKGKGPWTFCAGSKELYDWADHNPMLASYPSNYTNDPHLIAQIDNFISINNCIEIDLYGQVSSESSGFRQISGVGGQLDFVTGAHMSRGGKSFICLRSSFTDKKTGQRKSRIVPTLPTGSIVSDPRMQTQYVVTEYGKINLHGLTTWERTEQLIGIAHPDFREELIKEADMMKIWRQSNKK